MTQYNFTKFLFIDMNCTDGRSAKYWPEACEMTCVNQHRHCFDMSLEVKTCACDEDMYVQWID